MAAISATVVCGVAQAADNSDDGGYGQGRSGNSQGDRSGLGSHLQRDGFGKYLSDPESFYYGPDDANPSTSDSDSDDEDSDDDVDSRDDNNNNEWDEGLYDTARGGKGGAAGTNSSDCSMSLGPGMKKQACKGGGSANKGADGVARYN